MIKTRIKKSIHIHVCTHLNMIYTQLIYHIHVHVITTHHKGTGL